MNTGDNNFSVDLDQPVLIPLEHLCCYEVSGEDAHSFLQGQLTNDIEAITKSRGQLSSYCTPKGRMLAIFYICPSQDKYLIVLRKDVAETVMQRLQMFILRSKVTIKLSSNHQTLFGVAGPSIDSILNTLDIASPQQEYDVTCTENLHCMKIPGIVARCMLIADSSLVETIGQLENVATQSFFYWQWLDIMTGIPSVSASTQESFVPQMANMELINGVSFSKGCYPGQEIVARLHYLGNASRRMYRIETSTDAEINPGDDIYSTASGSNQAIGTIVTSTKESADKIAALAILRIEAAQQSQLAIGSPDGVPATVMPLPYDIPSEQKQ